MPAAAGDRGEGLGVQVVRRGVDQVAGAVELLGHGGGALDGGLVRLVARLGAEQGDLGERGPWRPCALRPPLPPCRRAPVGGEGVRAEQRALGDRGGRLGVLGGQRERGLLRAGQRAGGGYRRRGAAPRCRSLVLLRHLAEADRQHDRRLEAGGAGSLVTSPSAPLAPRVSRTAASLPPNALSTASAPGATTGALGALGDADDDGVRAQAGRGGGAESQCSHGGEVLASVEFLGRGRWVGPPGASLERAANGTGMSLRASRPFDVSGQIVRTCRPRHVADGARPARRSRGSAEGEDDQGRRSRRSPRARRRHRRSPRRTGARSAAAAVRRRQAARTTAAAYRTP